MTMLRILGVVIAARMRLGRAFCVTVDFQTLEDQTVTVRERDGMTQIRLHINELPANLVEKVTWM